MAEYHFRMRDLPPDERPREKLFLHGEGALSNAELLAVLLRCGNKGQNAVDLARNLLKAVKAEGVGEGEPYRSGLRYLVTASASELCRIDGIGPAKAAQIKAAIELGRRLSCSVSYKMRISTPQDARNLLLERMRYLDKEHFMVILLDTKNQVIAIEPVSVGILNSSLVHPREVFRESIRRGAAAIILAHNHPSGDPEPSRDDVEVTRRLVEAGKLLGIEVLDHLVFGEEQYVSLRERGSPWHSVR